MPLGERAGGLLPLHVRDLRSHLDRVTHEEVHRIHVAVGVVVGGVEPRSETSNVSNMPTHAFTWPPAF